MLRQKKVPSYGLHKPSGQARIVVDGQSIYLGKHGSTESYEQYARWVNKLAGARPSNLTGRGFVPMTTRPMI